MVSLKRRESEHEHALRIMRTSGYVVLFGILIGVTIGIYTLFSPPLFSIFSNISQYESTLFFLGVYLPSFIIIVAIGYVFATTPKLVGLNLWRTAAICMLIFLCLSLSAISSFNYLSFLGGFIALIATVYAYTKPAFKALWKREACFFVETGTILTASGSMLFLLMWFISRFLPTYGPGMYELGYSYLYTLLAIEVLSLLTFFLMPFLSLHGENVGLCGAISLVVSILSLTNIIQNLDIYFSLSAYQGIFLACTGTILMFCGSFIYIKLWREALLSPAFEPSFLYRGKYCPYCGAPWIKTNNNLCFTCGKNLHWKSKGAFCSYCGRLVPQNNRNCPHCKENVESLPFYISLARKQREPGKLEEAFGSISDSLYRSELYSFKNFVYVCILAFLFAFLWFIFSAPTAEQLTGEQYYFLFTYYGFPLRWLKLTYYAGTPALLRRATPQPTLLWGALILDFVFYSLSALAIVYGSLKLSAKFTARPKIIKAKALERFKKDTKGS